MPFYLHYKTFQTVIYVPAKLYLGEIILCENFVIQYDDGCDLVCLRKHYGL